MREINRVVVHCSDSTFGSSILIDEWHRERGWDSVGYHFVICNGKIENNNFLECMDGSIERGRDIDKMGAHVSGHNSDSIGVCLIGKDSYTDKQMLSLKILLSELMIKYNLKYHNIFGHRELDPRKSCPTGLDLDKLRSEMK